MELKKAIENGDKTRREICEEVGITPPQLSMYETGMRNVPVFTVKRLAKAVGLTPADLRPDLAAIFGPDSK